MINLLGGLGVAVAGIARWTWIWPLLASAILLITLVLGGGGIVYAAAGAALFGAVFAAVYHAEMVAHRVGEPFGTLILALAVTVIETALIVSVMIAAPAEKAGLARDTVFAAVMIVCNGIVGACLLWGGVRYREQGFQLQGATAALAVLVALTGLTMVLPNLAAPELGPLYNKPQLIFASAGVQQAQAQADNAEADFQRKKELLKRGVSTQAVFDQSRATQLSSRAQLEQARRQLELANHNLDRSKLLAPFAGTVARVEVKSFAQVAAGQPIATLYSDHRFEMSFLVPSPTFQSLAVGQAVGVKIADMPDRPLKGEIKELGSKAEQVSAFPVVIRLDNSVPGLNAGMSVEVRIEEPLIGGGSGFLVPLSVPVPEVGKVLQNTGTVFRYEHESSTVRKRTIAVGGVRDNRLVITEGIAAGDLLASAGVSYLSDGQKVNLLPLELPLREAILAASEKRLRPILLTSATTVLGLAPMAIAGGALWHPMAILMMSGLAIASLLTLFFVPAGHFLLFRIQARSVTR